jgi:hypothetical protein
MMSGETKDRVLKRENRFERLVGVLAGSIIDKADSKELNDKTLRALKDQYTQEKDTSPWSYVEISHTSGDPEVRELWDMLPKDTRMAVQKIWGTKSFFVRKDSLDGIFGYRKKSASDWLMKEQGDLKGMESSARTFFHMVAKWQGMDDAKANNFAKRMGVYVMKGEQGWQEIYREVKDFIVVKTGVVTLSNIYSNASLLWVMGVKDGWSKQLVALRGIMAYEEQHKRLMELETKVSAGYIGVDPDEAEREIVRLRNEMAINPVKPLIDAGLMPTIVEDVDLTDDPYSYKSGLGEALEQYTNRVPTAVKTATKTVLMAHDTPLYKLFSRATQYSDFVARYALYDHLVNVEGKTHEQAVRKSLEAFIHYDVPMQRDLQYLDDMGFTPFVKYFYRIQRVLMDAFKERPARVLGMVLLNRFVDLGPIVLDSSMISHLFNNPFRSGAFRIFDAAEEAATIQAGMALLH